MFEARLRFLLYVLAVIGVVLVLRLGELQLVRADEYRHRAERALVLQPESLPFVRGRILDRTGRILVQDEPSWDLSMEFPFVAFVAGDTTSKLLSRLKRLHRRGWHEEVTDNEALLNALRDDLSVMWKDIVAFSTTFNPVNESDLRETVLGAYERVMRVRRAVANRRGFDAPVAEEMQPHALLAGLDAQQQVAAREQFVSRYPWLQVVAGQSRQVLGNAEPLAHVVGRLGRVDAEDVANDPQADDPFARYLASDRIGITGVERLTEQTLRGRRGQWTEDRQGRTVDDECFTAEDGGDVALTILTPLQEQLYKLLGQAVEEIPESSGGAIVVLDVPTRDVLALVSYPSYDPNRFDALYPQLRDDTVRLPLRNRAIANQYAPGSTIKPLVCLQGLMGGQIRLDTLEECTGYLFPNIRDRWRCWKIHGTNLRKAHGLINVVQALTGSCNVFMYRLGERIGVDGLCNAFDMVGVGRETGIGLHEARGINPTPSWLMSHKNLRATPGSARLFAIGQGELSMTPLQVANLMATYASGVYKQVSLIRDRAPTTEWALPATAKQWHAIRQGIYGVVNDPDGTAYRYAHFEHPRFALCGKTGSATAHRWPTSYRIPYVDADGEQQVAVVRAGAKHEALRTFKRQHPDTTITVDEVDIASRWPPEPPPEGDHYSHAWFGGFLQAKDSSGEPNWSVPPSAAFVVLVEFGGSGGRTSGPLAKRVSQLLIDAGVADGVRRGGS